MSAANDKIAYGVNEAAEALSVGKSTIWRYIHDGKIRTVKLGGRTLIPRIELERLVLPDAA